MVATKVPVVLGFALHGLEAARLIRTRTELRQAVKLRIIDRPEEELVQVAEQASVEWVIHLSERKIVTTLEALVVCLAHIYQLHLPRQCGCESTST